MHKLSLKCGCVPWYVAAFDGLGVCGPEGNACINSELKTYKEDLIDRSECDCLNDCEMVHFFATGKRESYEDYGDLVDEKWFDAKTGSGLLYNYLVDPEHVLVDELSKSMLLLAHNTTSYVELARRRFNDDVVVLNFFFDTPIITQIKIEMRTSIFDMISAIGGTLGLFTGISVITFIEIMYWGARFAFEMLRRGTTSTAGVARNLLRAGEIKTSKDNEAADRNDRYFNKAYESTASSTLSPSGGFLQPAAGGQRQSNITLF